MAEQIAIPRQQPLEQETRRCIICTELRRKDEFSNTQWNKLGNKPASRGLQSQSKCKSCVDVELTRNKERLELARSTRASQQQTRLPVSERVTARLAQQSGDHVRANVYFPAGSSNGGDYDLNVYGGLSKFEYEMRYPDCAQIGYYGDPDNWDIAAGCSSD
jgi:hypothetical protein